MTARVKANASAQPARDSQGTDAKTRVCLRCRNTFESDWAGTRICEPCKRTTVWRNGTPKTY